MATNLTSADATTFNTANMKPESAEQIDALWGQNMADNLAYLLWGKHSLVCSVYSDKYLGDANSVSGTWWFKKRSGLDTLYGTMNMLGTGGVLLQAGTGQVAKIYVNGVEAAFGTYLAQGGNSEAYPWSYDTSGLSDDTEYTISSFLEENVNSTNAVITCSVFETA